MSSMVYEFTLNKLQHYEEGTLVRVACQKCLRGPCACGRGGWRYKGDIGLSHFQSSWLHSVSHTNFHCLVRSLSQLQLPLALQLQLTFIAVATATEYNI